MDDLIYFAEWKTLLTTKIKFISLKDGGESQPMHFAGNRETILVFIEMKLVDSNY